VNALSGTEDFTLKSLYLHMVQDPMQLGISYNCASPHGAHMIENFYSQIIVSTYGAGFPLIIDFRAHMISGFHRRASHNCNRINYDCSQFWFTCIFYISRFSVYSHYRSSWGSRFSWFDEFLQWNSFYWIWNVIDCFGSLYELAKSIRGKVCFVFLIGCDRVILILGQRSSPLYSFIALFPEVS
jgi:hypothetical protein